LNQRKERPLIKITNSYKNDQLHKLKTNKMAQNFYTKLLITPTNRKKIPET